MSQARGLPYFAFFGLGTVWGSNFLFMKEALEVLPPLQIAFLRVLFGALPILGFALYKRALKLRDLKHFKHFISMALLANVFPFYFFVKGTQYLSSGAAGVISGTIPLMTALLVLLLLPTEKLTRRKLGGLFLGLVGVILVANLSTQTQDGQLLGSGFMMAGSLGYAGAMIYTKKFITPLKMGSIALAAFQTVCASIIMAIVVPFDGIGVLTQNSTALISVVVGLGLLGTGFAFVAFYFVIDRLGSVTASSVYYIPPVVALAIGALFRDEPVSWFQVLGALAIVAGIYFSSAALATDKRLTLTISPK